jgi:Domain of unknown function (DUF4177)
MFTKACLVVIAGLLTAILVTQRPQEVAHAQGRIEYKFVRTEVFLALDGKEVSGGENVRYFRTQDALNEYAKEGWQLVSASYAAENGRNVGYVIFMKK